MTKAAFRRINLKRRIEQLHSKDDFNALALDVFRYQSRQNETYAEYLRHLTVNPDEVTDCADIPFLPIEFFKSRIIKTGHWNPQIVFSSSGTTGVTTSQHFIRSLDDYLEGTVRGFEQFYGTLEKYCVLALLPAYLEREGSSLVTMAGHWITRSQHPHSGFFLYNYQKLQTILERLTANKQPTILLGVTFALLDLAEQYGPLELGPETIIMETGGMKGRRKELIRSQLHAILTENFGVPTIHSEYGMTELQSQAYLGPTDRFQPIHTLKVQAREVNDPFAAVPFGKLGALNCIDLLNLDSCSFIATDDLGKVAADGTFEVLGRMDASDIRGCNLLVL